MKTLLKKLTLSFISGLILLFSVAPLLKIAAAPTDPPQSPIGDFGSTGTWYNQSFRDWYGKVSDPNNPSEIFGERYTSAQVEWVIYGIFAFFINNIFPQGTAGACANGDLTACASGIKTYFDSLTSSNTSQVNTNKTLVSLIFADRPLSGISYVREKLRNFSLVPTAQAQTLGFGFNALKPVRDMWVGARDIAFGLFVLVAIIFAFMIMFRVKISPQTVVTVQSAIPKIVLSLILVTFSYAIAGFMVDLMYVVIGLLSLVFASFMPKVFGEGPPVVAIFSLLTQGNILGVIPGLNIQTGIFFLIFFYLSPLIITLIILTLVVGAASAGLLFLIPAIILLLVIVIGLWISIKTIWALFKALANVLLLTIFAPLYLVLGLVVPSLSFSQWLKSFASNLSVFVVTGALWFFAMIFLVQGVSVGLGEIASDLATALVNPVWGAVNLGADLTKGYSTWPPLLGAGSPVGVGFLFLGVSFVMFTLIPKATEIIQGFISGRPFAYGTAIGEAFAPATAAWGGFGKGAVSRRGAELADMYLIQSGRLPKTGLGGLIGSGISAWNETTHRSHSDGYAPPKDRRT